MLMHKFYFCIEMSYFIKFKNIYFVFSKNNKIKILSINIIK